MELRRSRNVLAALALLFAFGSCRASAPSHATAPIPAPPTQVAAAPAPAQAPAPPTTPAPKNRDAHGNPDVAHYVQSLESPARVADLQVDLVVSKLALATDSVVGDLGCGPGVFSAAFSKACPAGIVYASDIEPGQLDQVREKIHAQALANVVPVLASLDDPHFPAGRCDVVFIGDTYHHLDDRVAYMKRLKAVFRPAGRLVLLEYKPGKLPVGPSAEHKLQPGVLEKELLEAGYEKIESFDTHPWHDFQVWRPR